MNIELSKAFDYNKVFVLTEKKYLESESDIGCFLQNKVWEYELWKRLILNPKSLNSDNKIFIMKNQESFLKEINWILKNIDKKSKK